MPVLNRAAGFTLLATALHALSGIDIALAGTAAPGFEIYVTNERSGDLTIIDGTTLGVIDTIAVGKRPRGVHVSPDGKTVYVAVSGTPLSGPPELDAHGNPIFKKDPAVDDDDDAGADKAADGIAVIDVATRRLVRKIAAGSDPEEFEISRDGSRIYISNEDTKSATVIRIEPPAIEHIIPIGREPEGVAGAPDGKFFYVTCEAGGDVYGIDTTNYAVIAHFKVEGRPRSVAFTPDGRIAFVPSESLGQLNVVDTTRQTVTQTLSLPAGSRPMRVALGKSGQKLYVSNGRAGTVSVLDTRSFELIDTIKVGSRPWGIVVSPDGKTLFAANGPSNDVSVVDLTTDKEVTRIKAGAGPWGLAIVP